MASTSRFGIGAERYRHLLVRQMVQMKNRVWGLLMETGVSHNKQRLRKVGYFRELLSTHQGGEREYPAFAAAEPGNHRTCRKRNTPWSVLSSGTLCWRRGFSASGRFREWDRSPR
jgi:hypothetical protein